MCGIKKIYRKLTKDQKDRGVVFSSSLSPCKYETDTVHEVFGYTSEDYKTMERLKDDKFFRGSHFNYNIIRS